MTSKKDSAEEKAPAPKTAAKKASVKKPPTQKAKQAADTTRRAAAVDEGQANIPPITEAEIAENARRDNIRASLEANQETVENLESQADDLREQSAKLLLSLYPQQGENDPHHVAVKGFLAASRAERANRASNPAKLKALIENMQKSPIDAAMTRHTKRGTRRPDRPIKTAEG
jgi:chromosome segregation ATPase